MEKTVVSAGIGSSHIAHIPQSGAPFFTSDGVELSAG